MYVISLKGEFSPTLPPIKEVTVADPPVSISQNEGSADVLSSELFGTESEKADEHSWNDHVIAKWRELSSKGM
ncbi:hypothetical protein ALC57_10872 [Trachymyrmex cornetzi]|uniref:Uncharacterized protein n=1 Tax=Trachymyrmex cornetzi TaxID=471704 RepID=A0A195DVI9_9HYME|nr:hypothetical protein ALC57_10872 [Trachymyrmex cornetzi]